MSRTSIPVDDSTKAILDELKREDETWDEFLRRVAVAEDPIEAGAWSDAEAERAKEKIRDARERWR